MKGLKKRIGVTKRIFDYISDFSETVTDSVHDYVCVNLVGRMYGSWRENHPDDSMYDLVSFRSKPMHPSRIERYRRKYKRGSKFELEAGKDLFYKLAEDGYLDYVKRESHFYENKEAED